MRCHTGSVGSTRGIYSKVEQPLPTQLGYLSADATRYALIGPAQAAGATFDLDALELLTQASSGYPYFVQLLGWETWAAAAAAGSAGIGLDHADAGVRAAERVIVEQILEPRFRRLAPREQDYLRAMSADGDIGSATADLVARLGVTDAHQLSYLRERLLTKHMIRAVARGRVAFTLPGMAAWLAQGAGPVRGIRAANGELGSAPGS